jgi:hypothetical protein
MVAVPIHQPPLANVLVYTVATMFPAEFPGVQTTVKPVADVLVGVVQLPPAKSTAGVNVKLAPLAVKVVATPAVAFVGVKPFTTDAPEVDVAKLLLLPPPHPDRTSKLTQTNSQLLQALHIFDVIFCLLHLKIWYRE